MTTLVHTFVAHGGNPLYKALEGTARAFEWGMDESLKLCIASVLPELQGGRHDVGRICEAEHSNDAGKVVRKVWEARRKSQPFLPSDLRDRFHTYKAPTTLAIGAISYQADGKKRAPEEVAGRVFETDYLLRNGCREVYRLKNQKRMLGVMSLETVQTFKKDGATSTRLPNLGRRLNIEGRTATIALGILNREAPKPSRRICLVQKQEQLGAAYDSATFLASEYSRTYEGSDDLADRIHSTNQDNTGPVAYFSELSKIAEVPRGTPPLRRRCSGA
eukprot:g8797.t1